MSSMNSNPSPNTANGCNKENEICVGLTSKFGKENGNEVLFGCSLKSERSNIANVISVEMISSDSSSKKRSLDHNGLLRYGETLESLFCLDDTTTETHKNLCREIAFGSKSDDCTAWWEVLQKAIQSISAAVDNNQSHELEKRRGTDLLRLHRRATTRLRAPSVSSTDNDDNENVKLLIFLSLARAQRRFGDKKPDDARRTYRHIQNLRLGEQDARLYLDLAAFEKEEGNSRAAVDFLKLGIERKAEPIQSLRDEVSKFPLSASLVIPPLPSSSIPNSNTTSTSIKRKTESTGHYSSKSPKNGLDTTPTSAGKENNLVAECKLHPFVDRIVPPLPSEKVVPSLPELSMNLVRNKGTQDAEKIMKTASVPTFCDTRQDETILTVDKRETGEAAKCNELKCDKNNAKLQIQLKNPPTVGKEREHLTETKRGVTFAPSPFSSKKPVLEQNFRRSLSSIVRTPLPRKRLLGGALRVHHEDDSAPKSNNGDASSLNQDGTAGSHSSSEDGSKTSDDSLMSLSMSPVPKLNRIDLSYMLTWNPDTFRKSSIAESTSAKKVSVSDGRNLSRIEEDTNEELAVIGGEKSVTKASKPPSLKCSGDCGEDENKMPQDKIVPSNSKSENRLLSPNHESAIVRENSVLKRDRRTASVAKDDFSDNEKLRNLNNDFLPLVSENNIVRVNGLPYAKLGVIGKGGSCKVYRALSKDCEVVAIKKVKLGGKDKRAIDGYANEIALLKKLSGNSSIIHLHDHEVDIKRKAIFLVMEPGEVDLNYVLQQQQKLAAQQRYQQLHSAAAPYLNMNFIRLTWQQMLSAVHSIHEERIIHGDLKPANFLFVRGALKLIDFGIAKAIQSDDTTNIYRDTQIGTLNYMSPEAILDTGSERGKAKMKLGRASDIWSLGCILYQMIYGKTPFADLHMIQKLQAIVNPSHQITYPAADEHAIDAMRQCLNRNADRRPVIVGENGLLNSHYFLHSNSNKVSC